jgi:hypothetical protein
MRRKHFRDYDSFEDNYDDIDWNDRCSNDNQSWIDYINEEFLMGKDISEDEYWIGIEEDDEHEDIYEC